VAEGLLDRRIGDPGDGVSCVPAARRRICGWPLGAADDLEGDRRRVPKLRIWLTMSAAEGERMFREKAAAAARRIVLT